MVVLRGQTCFEVREPVPRGDADYSRVCREGERGLPPPRVGIALGFDLQHLLLHPPPIVVLRLPARDARDDSTPRP